MRDLLGRVLFESPWRPASGLEAFAANAVAYAIRNVWFALCGSVGWLEILGLNRMSYLA
jgi:hypothetical protein